MIKRCLILVLLLSSCATGPVTESVTYEKTPQFTMRDGFSDHIEMKYEASWE